MPFAFFQVPADASPEVAGPLNSFLCTHRIVRVTRMESRGAEFVWSSGFSRSGVCDRLKPGLQTGNCVGNRFMTQQLRTIAALGRRCSTTDGRK